MREDGYTARPSGCEQMNSRRDPDDYEAWVSQYIPSRLLISGRSILIGVVIAAGLIIGACQFSALITMSDRVAMAARVKI